MFTTLEILGLVLFGLIIVAPEIYDYLVAKERKRVREIKLRANP